MLEHALEARYLLGGQGEESWAGLRIAERRGRALASVSARRGAHDALAPAVETHFGLALPGPGRSSGDDRLGLYCCGHEQWFADADAEAFPRLAASLEQAVGDHASITDQGHAWASLTLSGARARDVMERLCPVDLHADAFPPGAVARTTIEHLRVQIALLDDAPAFVILTPSSSAASFLDALRHAARSACGSP